MTAKKIPGWRPWMRDAALIVAVLGGSMGVGPQMLKCGNIMTLAQAADEHDSLSDVDTATNKRIDGLQKALYDNQVEMLKLLRGPR